MQPHEMDMKMFVDTPLSTFKLFSPFILGRFQDGDSGWESGYMGVTHTWSVV
jgi:hypothetical protein